MSLVAGTSSDDEGEAFETGHNGCGHEHSGQAHCGDLAVVVDKEHREARD